MAQQAQVRTHFKTPEGVYTLHSERLTGLVPFSASRATRLTLAELAGGDEAGVYVLFHVAEYLHICPYAATDKAPLRSLTFNPGGAGTPVLPTCHAYQAAADGLDLLVGLSTGEVAAVSLAAQLAAGPTNTRPVVMQHFNSEQAADNSRCTGVAWLPASDGLFAVAHLSGNVFLYQKSAVLAGSSEAVLRGMKVSSAGPGPAACLPHPASVPALAASPDGTRLATACSDGVLRIFDVASRQLVAGFKSYYGGLLCCAWSGDGRYVAAGGEDDLVTLYGCRERAACAWGQGHTSWPAALHFDAWQVQGGGGPLARTASSVVAPGGDIVYRLASTGQDCQLLLWDFALPQEVLPSLPSIRSRSSGGTGSPAAASEVSPGGGYATASSTPMSTSTGSAALQPSSAASTPTRHGSNNSGGGGGPTANGGQAGGPASRRPGRLPPQISPAVPRAEMVLSPPIMQHRVHLEPMSDVLCTREALFTCCHSGQVKCWRRPVAAAPPDAGNGPAVAAQQQQPQRSLSDQQSEGVYYEPDDRM